VKFTSNAQPATEDFDRPTSLRARFPELAQVWTIDLSLLLDGDSRTTELSTYVILNLPVEFRRLLKTQLFTV